MKVQLCGMYHRLASGELACFLVPDFWRDCILSQGRGGVPVRVYVQSPERQIAKEDDPT